MSEKVDAREWLTGEGPEHLWLCIEPEDGAPASSRKRRLFVVAFCRRLWDVFLDERSRAAVEVAERYADGQAGEAERVNARNAASEAEVLAPLRTASTGARGWRAATSGNQPRGSLRSGNGRDAGERLARAQHLAAEAATSVMMTDDHLAHGFHRASEALYEAGGEDIYSLHMTLLDEVFAAWLRPGRVAFDSAWRTTDVTLLAKGIYEERAFDRMPILADALQDAGCDSDDILGHLRDPHATHVRGCWALDLVLGKE